VLDACDGQEKYVLNTSLTQAHFALNSRIEKTTQISIRRLHSHQRKIPVSDRQPIVSGFMINSKMKVCLLLTIAPGAIFI